MTIVQKFTTDRINQNCVHCVSVLSRTVVTIKSRSVSLSGRSLESVHPPQIGRKLTRPLRDGSTHRFPIERTPFGSPYDSLVQYCTTGNKHRDPSFIY